MSPLTLLLLASAIGAATPDPNEQHWLFATAAEESGWRDDIIWCRTVGDNGRSVGAFQTSFRSAGEQFAICHDLDVAARVALERLRESHVLCRHLPVEERGSMYCSGKCGGVGASISRRRWRFMPGP